jgi:5-methyltetrahydrofolate--homocysteine methyltransferase
MSASTRTSNSAAALRRALSERVVVADGAMRTMLQAQDPSIEDFQGHEGCNEVLNATRPDVVRAVADERSTPDQPRWVIGSMGPGTKLPTLGFQLNPEQSTDALVLHHPEASYFNAK